MKYADEMPGKEIFLADAVEIADEFLWCGDTRVPQFYVPEALGKAGWSQYAAVAVQMAASSFFPANSITQARCHDNMQICAYEAYRRISEVTLKLPLTAGNFTAEKESLSMVLAYLRDVIPAENISLTKLFLEKAN